MTKDEQRRATYPMYVAFKHLRTLQERCPAHRIDPKDLTKYPVSPDLAAYLAAAYNELAWLLPGLLEIAESLQKEPADHAAIEPSPSPPDCGT